MIELGLTSFFKSQVTSEEYASGCLVRVVQVHRSRAVVSDGIKEQSIALGSGWFDKPVEERPTVGDWVLLDPTRERVERLLKRKSVVQRVVPGTKSDTQLIAANIDTLFIVTSCNEEFNLSRLERYLSLAVEAQVTPVVIFTKKDLVDDSNYFLEQIKAVDDTLAVEVIDARDSATLDCMRPWITEGATIAIVGSSGVGKSTLVNTLSGFDAAKTGGVREQDKKGRHTTTHRELYRLPGGGMIIDVPGMRELKVGRFDKSASEIFPDIEALAEGCKFSDCSHERELHCNVMSAIRAGNLDARRFNSYKKLLLEQQIFAEASSSTKSRAKSRVREVGGRDKSRKKALNKNK